MDEPRHPRWSQPLMNVTYHARDRLLEYYSIEAGQRAWDAAILEIVDRQAVLLKLQCGGGAEVWCARIMGQAVAVVWDPSRAVVITVLPPGASSLNTSLPRPRRTQSSSAESAMRFAPEIPADLEE